MNKIGVTILKAFKKGGTDVNTQLLDEISKHNLDAEMDKRADDFEKEQVEARRNTWCYRVGEACKSKIGAVVAAAAGVLIAYLTALKISIGG